MSGKTSRQIRKSFNEIKKNSQNVADSLIIELFNSPFKYRFIFAMKLIFHKRVRNG